MSQVVITTTVEDPVFTIWRWKQDSARLFVLQPVLDLVMEIPEQPCVLGERYACRPQSCSPCAIYEIQNRMRRSVQ